MQDHERRERDGFIDRLRVLAVLIVVGAHWATTTVIWETDRISAENALSVIPATHPATWLLQVMPLLFFVGGFANARSLARHDGGYLAYLGARLVRLLTPTVVFSTVWLLVGVVSELLPLPEPNVVERAADLAALPFWFIGLYVVVVALAPVMLWLHGKFGWWVPAFLVGGAAVVDVLVHGIGYDTIGVANYAFVWLLPHQLGFFYADGRLERVSHPVAAVVAVAGLAAMTVAVTAGGYPVSMVGVPGEDRWNTEPPSLALVALTVWLLGLALLARRGWGSWGAKKHRLVSRLNAVTLTMYLWHVSAAAIAAALIYPLGYPRAKTGSALWWATRPLWMAALVPFFVLLVYGFRRFEVHRSPGQVPRSAGLGARHVAAAVAVVSAALALLGFGATGFDRVATESGETVLAFALNPLQNVVHLAVGAGVLWFVYRSRSPGLGGGAASLLYLGLGAAGSADGIALFGTNAATGALHLVVGSLGVGLLIVATARDRRRTRPRSPGPPATSSRTDGRSGPGHEFGPMWSTGNDGGRP